MRKDLKNITLSFRARKSLKYLLKARAHDEDLSVSELIVKLVTAGLTVDRGEALQ